MHTTLGSFFQRAANPGNGNPLKHYITSKLIKQPELAVGRALAVNCTLAETYVISAHGAVRKQREAHDALITMMPSRRH